MIISSTLRALWSWIQSFWWLPAIYYSVVSFLLPLWVQYAYDAPYDFHLLYGVAFVIAYYFLVLTTLFLFIRPSVHQKSLRYWYGYWKHYLYGFLPMLLMAVLSIVFSFIVSGTFYKLHLIWLLYAYGFLFFSASCIVLLLFFFDSLAGVRSLLVSTGNALKCIMDNIIAMAVLVGCVLLVAAGYEVMHTTLARILTTSFISQVLVFLRTLFYIVLYSISVSFLTTLYVKYSRS